MQPALAKIGSRPSQRFLELFVEVCTVMSLEGFKPHELSAIIHGEHMQLVDFYRCGASAADHTLCVGQALQSSITSPARSSWTWS
jgi:hypothetical protein